MYGTQAETSNASPVVLFENDVKMYGTQAVHKRYIDMHQFENDVKMYGTQAVCDVCYIMF